MSHTAVQTKLHVPKTQENTNEIEQRIIRTSFIIRSKQAHRVTYLVVEITYFIVKVNHKYQFHFDGIQI